MKRRTAARVVLVAAIVAISWWVFRRVRPSVLAAEPGEIAVEWSGRYRGRAVLPATLNWCPGTRLGILQGISTDTGVSIVVYETESLTSGRHAVVSPTLLPAVPRPGATAAIRWARDSAVLVGFRSTSGMVQLRAGHATVTGTLNVRMHAPGNSDTLVLKGSFDRVPVTATAIGCS